MNKETKPKISAIAKEDASIHQANKLIGFFKFIASCQDTLKDRSFSL
ncbi:MULTISPECIES: hypothetical protein [Priestia]|nr:MULTISPECIES: hypothetical protein [Priestia]MBY6088652.1 hypothetical protein [Priestia flexa]